MKCPYCKSKDVVKSGKRYNKYTTKQIYKLKPKIKGKIHLDEVVLKEKKEKRYDINAVDGKTGYNLGHLLTRGLFIEDFWKFFEELREKKYDQCLEI